MRYCSIASGSSGNCHYVEMGGVSVLVDMGTTLKAAADNLMKVGVDPASPVALFITHEHADHIRGVGPWARKFHLPVFATEGTWEGMERTVGRIDPLQKRVIEPGRGYYIRDLRIEPFYTYHDANEPVGYVFTCGSEKLAIMTDTGMVSGEMRKLLAGCKLAVVEANHDIEMLMGGPYPLSLKRRIRSNLGHLSNEDCGHLIAELWQASPDCEFVLAHLSEENNRPEQVLETVRGILQYRLGRCDCHLTIAERFEPTGMFEL